MGTALASARAKNSKIELLTITDNCRLQSS